MLRRRFSEWEDIRVVVTQVPLHGIRLSQRELHQMNVPDVKVETQNASIRNDEGSALSCTRLRIPLNTICGKLGFNSLKTPLNHGASYTKDARKETLTQHNSVTYRMLPRTGKLH